MKNLRLRAVILAAGHGRRLRPLTSFVPKPLLPIRGRPVADYTLQELAAVGCEAAAINLHHRGDDIRQRFGDTWGGIPITYSPEETILGTLGALSPLRDFLDAADLILVLNGDSLCRWPLKSLVRKHRRRRAAATLLVSRQRDPEPFGGGVGLDASDQIVSFRPGDSEETLRRRVFMGAHVLSPGLFDHLPDGPADFVDDLYLPLLSQGGMIAAHETRRKWHDLGTPDRYRRGALSWGRGRNWLAPDVAVAAEAKVTGSVVEEGADLGKRCEIRRSVVLPGARVGECCRVFGSILGPGVVLPPNTAVDGRMVTRVRADTQPTVAGSAVGGLLYDPI